MGSERLTARPRTERSGIAPVCDVAERVQSGRGRTSPTPVPVRCTARSNIARSEFPWSTSDSIASQVPSALPVMRAEPLRGPGTKLGGVFAAYKLGPGEPRAPRLPYADPVDEALKDQLWWLPIFIAGLALLVSTMTFAWNLFKHVYLDGPRVKVELRPAVFEPEFSLAKWVSDDGKIQSRDESKRHRGIECAWMCIENSGRTAVTISEPSIAFRGPRKFLKWPRHSIGPRVIPGATSIESDARDDVRAVRLNPYDRVVFVMDIHPALRAARESVGPDRKRLVVRAQVLVAGRRNPKKGPWKKRWRVPKGASSLYNWSQTIPVDLALLQPLLKDRGKDAVPSTIDYTVQKIAVRLWETRDNDNVLDRARRALDVDEVRYSLGVEGVTMAVHHVAAVLRGGYGTLDWSGAAKAAESERKSQAPSSGTTSLRED